MFIYIHVIALRLLSGFDTNSNKTHVPYAFEVVYEPGKACHAGGNRQSMIAQGLPLQNIQLRNS